MKNILSILLIFSASGFLFAQSSELTIPIDKNVKSQDSSSFFVIVEEMPIFEYKDCKNTTDCFLRYISDSIKFSSMDCFGRVIIQFVVEPDSSLSNIKIIRGFENCPGYNEEAIRLIESMPRWIPGKQKDIPVRVLMTFPINFDPNE